MCYRRRCATVDGLEHALPRNPKGNLCRSGTKCLYHHSVPEEGAGLTPSPAKETPNKNAKPGSKRAMVPRSPVAADDDEMQMGGDSLC